MSNAKNSSYKFKTGQIVKYVNGNPTEIEGTILAERTVKLTGENEYYISDRYDDVKEWRNEDQIIEVIGFNKFKVNQTQLYYKERCIENAAKYKMEQQEIEITHERVSEYRGELSFFLSIKAKESDGILFILDKTWFVKIGRKGGVSSRNLKDRARGFKRNKYCTFIS